MGCSRWCWFHVSDAKTDGGRWKELTNSSGASRCLNELCEMSNRLNDPGMESAMCVGKVAPIKTAREIFRDNPMTGV